ncbi:MAG: glycoside hydrolase [Candidatus Eremiobacteraeota bacterium]|nr:glycoside hydrolase [Candidatus Eremiobacteraeota bacterium]
MRFRRSLLLAGLCSLAASYAPAAAMTGNIGPAQYAAMQWRFIGPLRGGRTKAVAGVADEIHRFYIAAVNGGIWRTDNAGRTWRPIFDAQATGSIGSLAVAPSDDNVVYAGSGEGLQRPDLSVGDGVYKSTDAGTTWTHLGLSDGQQIPAIAVDAKDPNRLFVAVLGHPYGPNDERGIYRSTDGGATFTRVLYRNDNTGAYDVKIDPHDPRTVYASLWAARQAPWEMGGSFETAGSGIYKSTDGGSSWKALSAGLPPRLGRAEIAIAPSNANVVYAAVDAPTGCGIYRSDDAGAQFSLVNSEDRVCERGDDLVAIAADPEDAKTVYVTTTSTYRSSDGGTTFTPIKGAPGGDDYQNIWINPLHPDIIALASDQGATISLDRGNTWSSWYNQPTAQMYHVTADDRFPYWVCSGQQESGSACVKSRGDWGETTERDWHPVGAEEYGYIAPDPLHSGIYYGGKVERFDERTGQAQEVSPNPLRSGGYRVVRTEPLLFDPIDKRTLLFGANKIYATRDGGMRWRTISPDLTRAHPAVPAVIANFERGDPEKGTHRGVVYALAASFRHEGTIWAGTDDGLLWRTRDGGSHWHNITPHDLTPWSKVSQIDASHFDDTSAYVAINRFRLDDLHPHAYRTHDGGAHWSTITGGLPEEPVNAVRADPKVAGLLYAATENGVYVSFDDGTRWQSLQLNLPHTSVRDIIVKDNDLAIGTHGRGFYILDDIEPLRELAQHGAPASARLYAPALAYRIRRDVNTDTPLPPEVPHGQNPPDGAVLDYDLPSAVMNVSIVIRDSRGTIVRKFSSADVAPPPIQFDKPAYWERPFTSPSADAGMHRFVWDLHEAPPHSVMTDLPISAVDHDTPRVPQGALVVPGRYTVELMAGGTSQSQTLQVVMDPRVTVSAGDLAAQYVMAHDAATLIDATHARMQAAHKKNDVKTAQTLGGLNAELSGLLDLIDGADAPAPQGTTQAYCRVSAAARKALGEPSRENACAAKSGDSP